MTLLGIEESRKSTTRSIVLLIRTVISVLGEQKDRTVWEIPMISRSESVY